MWPDILVASIKSAIEYESVLWDKELTDALAALRDEQLYIACLNESISELKQIRDKLIDGQTETYSTEATGHDPVSHNLSSLELPCLRRAKGASDVRADVTGEDAQNAAPSPGNQHTNVIASPASQGLTEAQSEEFQDLSLGMPRSADTGLCSSTVARMTTTQLWWHYTNSHPSNADSADELDDDDDDSQRRPLIESGAHLQRDF